VIWIAASVGTSNDLGPWPLLLSKGCVFELAAARRFDPNACRSLQTPDARFLGGS